MQDGRGFQGQFRTRAAIDTFPQNSGCRVPLTESPRRPQLLQIGRPQFAALNQDFCTASPSLKAMV